MPSIQSGREFMKSGFAEMDGRASPQSRGLPAPPVQVPHDPSAPVVDLPRADGAVVRKRDVYDNLRDRRSRRDYIDEALSPAELGFLLWATQGIDHATPDGLATFRPVPSAGARHAFETYVVANRVEDLDTGIWRYLPLTHQLVFLFAEQDVSAKLSPATFGQGFVARAAAVFVWSCVPYRGEWRYQSEAHKTMLLDAGHVGQNLYLAAEAIECGACAIAAYDQKAIDALLRLDGKEEFAIYLATVGRLPPQAPA